MKIANYLRVTILTSFISALVCACDYHDDANTCRPEVVEESDYLEVKPLIYKGHRYLWFRTKIRKGFGGVVEDPECEKCKECKK